MKQQNRTFTREDAREFDRRLITDFRVPSILLMENAGRGAADEIAHMLASRKLGGVLIVCGPGNNGGDGYVIARRLTLRGYKCEVVSVVEKAALADAPDARMNLEIFERLGGHVREIAAPFKLPKLKSLVDRNDVIVDCVFGTGLARPIEGFFAGVVNAINAGRHVVAIDVPSGMDADTGKPLGAAVRAELTITFVAAKKGFDNPRGKSLTGKIRVCDIGAAPPEKME